MKSSVFLGIAFVSQQGLGILDLIDQISAVVEGYPLLQEIFNSLKLLRVLIMQAVKIVIFLCPRNKFLEPLHGHLPEQNVPGTGRPQSPYSKKVPKKSRQ